MNERRFFPLITELPKLLDASDWLWQTPPRRDYRMDMSPEWWIGTDREGRMWLVKMRDSYYAYREHVFASLAQRMGISCQSSTYLLIQSETAEPRLHAPDAEPFQLALWFMDEHSGKPCSTTCPLAELNGKARDYSTIEWGTASGIAHFSDLARADILGRLCGQFEPHGGFFTRNHEYVVIDNECMFAESPSLNTSDWHKCKDARPLILDVCRDLVRIEDHALHELATLPGGFTVTNRRNLSKNLLAAKAEASAYLGIFGEP